MPRRDGGDGRACPLGNVVALRGALVLADEVHLEVRDVRTAAHEVVAHEAVEIEWRCRARVDLILAHLGFIADRPRHLLRDGRRRFERRAFGRVEDDLKL
jgi:hypothetical protein